MKLFVVLAIACPSIAQASKCEEVGRVLAMLGVTGTQCSMYRLTAEGKEMYKQLSEAVSHLSRGEPMACITAGKIAIMEQFADADLRRRASAGDTAGFEAVFCEKIAKELVGIAQEAGTKPMIEVNRPWR